jgi:hypothetical protein
MQFRKIASAFAFVCVSQPICAQTISNSGFESPSLSPSQYSNASPTGWTASGSAGHTFVAVGNGFTDATVEPPDGKQVGFIQGIGSLQQLVYMPAGGPAIISFSAMQRHNYQPAGNQSIELLVDGNPVPFKLGGESGTRLSITPPPEDTTKPTPRK